MKRTTAPNSVGGLHVDRNPGTGTTGTAGIAEDRNNLQEEICAVIEGLGLTLDGGSQTQLLRAVRGLSHQVGELLFMETEETPSADFPAIPRNVDQDITPAMYPPLVAKLRAQKAKVKGVTDHTVSVSGSTVTFPDTPAANALVKLLQEDSLVSGFLNGGQAATFAADTSTSTTQRCLNIAGTDYAISGAINLVARTVVVTGTPASGSQTACVYTYRIAGSANARLHKIAGFVGVAAGDADGEVVGGFRKMDRGQGVKYNFGTSGLGNSGSAGGVLRNDSGIFPTTTAITDGTNGTPRTGKTTDPRTVGQYVYTWAGIKAA